MTLLTRPNVIKLLDFASFLGLLVLMSTGVLMRFTLPPRSRGETVWGWTRHDWGAFHYYLSLFFITLMALHLLTHIKYIKHAIQGKASREHNYRLLIGGFGFVLLVVVAFSPVLLPVSEF